MNTPPFTDKVAEIFVKVDDFCNLFENEFKKHALPPASDAKIATENQPWPIILSSQKNLLLKKRWKKQILK